MSAVILPETTTSDFLSDIQPSESSWDKHRLNAASIEYIYAAAGQEWYSRYAERIRECANVLEFGYKPDSDGLVEFRFARTHFCRVRFCPVCQWRRQMKWQARFYEALDVIDIKYPTYRWVFATFTVKNCPNESLRATLNEMNAAFVRLTKRKQWPGVGWIKSVEVTRGSKGDSHPHLHVLMLVKPSYFTGASYLKQERWAALWQDCLRVSYQPLVDVRAVKGDVRNAVAETLKYSVKPSDGIEDAHWLYIITRQLFKTRAVGVGGVLKKLMSEVEPDPSETCDPENPGGHFFKWQHGRYKRSEDR